MVLFYRLSAIVLSLLNPNPNVSQDPNPSWITEPPEHSTQIQRYSVGSFVIHWYAQEPTPKLKIYHRSQISIPIWETLDGISFLEAAYGPVRTSENQGSFQIKEIVKERYRFQSIDSVQQNENDFQISGQIFGDQLRRSLNSIDYSIIYHPISESQLAFDIQLNDRKLATSEKLKNFRITLRFASTADERFFGFGEQYSFFDLKGKKIPILIQEQGLGRGLQPLSTLLNRLAPGVAGSWSSTYAAVPHYMTSKLHSLFLENYEYSVFDLTKKDRVEIEVFSAKMKGRILHGKDPLSLIESYTQYTGRMSPLPAWTQEGAVIGIQGGSEKVKNVQAQLEEYGTPVTAFWIQDWVGRFQNRFGSFLWWNWELDQKNYSDWSNLLPYLKSKGIRILTYINPFLMDISMKPGSNRSMLKEALDLGYVAQKKEGTPYLFKFLFSKVGILDLTNSRARSWIKDLIRSHMIVTGNSGWMADFGESFPMDAAVDSSEENAFRYHNKYAEDWAQIQKEVLEESGMMEDYVVFMRAGYTRSPGLVRLFWLGDQLTSWDAYDGIKTALIGLLSSGVSGFSLNHSDIGGYAAVTQFPFKIQRTQELFMRWTEMNAFTSFFRTHEGNNPEANHQFNSNPQTLSHFTYFAKVFRTLAPYRKKLMEEAFLKGYPLVRSLFLHYPQDPEVYSIVHEFLLGSEFLIAPVLDPDTNDVNVYFPKGEWLGLFSDIQIITGEKGVWKRIDAPLGRPAVFYQKGSQEGEAIKKSLNSIESFR